MRLHWGDVVDVCAGLTMYGNAAAAPPVRPNHILRCLCRVAGLCEIEHAARDDSSANACIPKLIAATTKDSKKIAAAATVYAGLT